MSESEPRVIIVGAGRHGERHLKAWKELGVAVGVFDESASRMDQLYNQYHVRIFHCLEQAIDWSTFVTIATPDHLHTPVVLEAIAQGRNVLSEKPATTNLDEAQTLQAQAEQKGLLFLVGQNLRFVSTFNRVRELVLNGDPANILGIHATYYHDKQKQRAETPWRNKENLLWGGGVHLVDLVSTIKNVPVISVFAIAGEINQHGLPEEYWVDLKFQSGVLATLNLAGNKVRNRYGVSLSVFGAQVIYETDDDEGMRKLGIYEKEGLHDTKEEVIENRFTIPQQVRTVYEYLTGQHPSHKPVPTLAEIMPVIRILDAAERLIKLQKSIELS